MGTEEVRTELVRLESTHCLNPAHTPTKNQPQSPAQLLVCPREAGAGLGRTGQDEQLSTTFNTGNTELWAPHPPSREEQQRNLMQEQQSSTYSKKQLLGDNWKTIFKEFPQRKKNPFFPTGLQWDWELLALSLSPK